MSSASSKPGSAASTEEHTKDIVRGLIELALSNRLAFYSRPHLADVRNNGGNRINMKLLQLLRKVEAAEGVDGAVKDTIDAIKGGSGSGSGSGTGSGSDSSPKKRKPKAQGDGAAGGGATARGRGKKVKVEKVVKAEVKEEASTGTETDDLESDSE